MITSLYRKVLPIKVRKYIYELFLRDVLWFMRGPMKCRWYYFYYFIATPKTEKEQAFKTWGKAGFSPYPYTWKKEYDNQIFEVYLDGQNGLPYIVHYGKNLYFRRNMISSASEVYKSLLIEQDERSAHRYVRSYKDLQNKTLLDIGSAEAFFALEVIEYIDHAYLFECDEDWIEALEATFAPWKNKITIVRKYVSDVNDENNITLNEYFKDKPSNNLFLKMDIEGYERKALKGAEALLKNAKNISGSVCIYHLVDDEETIHNLLQQNGLNISINSGFLYMGWEMRHAIMRFQR